jgi:hypothetical protein
VLPERIGSRFTVILAITARGPAQQPARLRAHLTYGRAARRALTGKGDLLAA